MFIDYFSVQEQVYIHVYKLKDSDLGFYHTGIELHGSEFTFCCDRGIVRHKPRKCDWGHFLGSIRLGEVSLSSEQLEELLEDMSHTGFASVDYEVMTKSCNTFTEVGNSCNLHVYSINLALTRLLLDGWV